MSHHLASPILKTGEIIRIVMVKPPDERWADPIFATLSHKPEKYLTHIAATFVNVTHNVVRYYMALSDMDNIYGIAMTAETQDGRGHVAHVFVREEHRGKGIARSLMNTLMSAFKQSGGTVLFLGTEYNSPAYRLYLDLGFGDYHGLPDGRMIWVPDYQFLTEDEALR